MLTKTLKSKVEYCLNKYPEAKENDTKLCNAVWFEFYKDHLKRDNEQQLYIRLIDIYNVPSQDDIVRIRRKIQNEEHKYIPSMITQKKRLEAEQSYREELGYSSIPSEVLSAFRDEDIKSTQQKML